MVLTIEHTRFVGQISTPKPWCRTKKFWIPADPHRAFEVILPIDTLAKPLALNISYNIDVPGLGVAPELVHLVHPKPNLPSLDA